MTSQLSGFERLVVGHNQGIARDALFVGAEHKINSFVAISEAARLAEPDSMLLVGPGGCNDIPLGRLAARFTDIHVVEIDTEATQRAALKLPEQLRKKIEIEKLDIANIGQKISEIAEEAEYPEELTHRILDAVQGYDPYRDMPRLSSDVYDFVCSHLVASQLLAIPFIYLNKIIKERFNREFQNEFLNVDRPLGVEAQRVIGHVPLAHIAKLAEVLPVGGVAHFADTYAKYQNGRLLPLLFLDKTAEAMKQSFDPVEEPKIWNWNTLSDDFVVVSHALVKN